MRTRTLGINGPVITEVGLGAWAIGGPWLFGWGAVDDDESVRTIHRAMDLGVNWIDTAAVYGLGHSEEVVAKAVAGRRGEALVATKCGLVWDDAGQVRRCSRPESIRREAEASLRRLRTSIIDLYQIHWPDPDVPMAESWGAMVRLREEGLVRWIGVSNYSLAEIQACHALHPVQSLQPQYSLLRRGLEDDLLPWCGKAGVGIIAHSPMASGLLSGSFDRSRLAPDDWRHKGNFFQEPVVSRVLELVERLRPMATRHRKIVGQLAVAWVLRRPEVTAAIVGARHPEQVDFNVRSSGWWLSLEELAEVDRLLGELEL
jgi:aryl-alcohol dehydrogenase-like predicted oxidoreductase